MKKFIVPLFIFLSIVAIILAVSSQNKIGLPNNQTAPTPTQKNIQSIPVTYFNDVIPGTSTEVTIAKSMGTPIRRDSINGQTTLVYPSGIGTRPINIDIDATGKVILIVEPVDTSVRFNQILGKYGQPDLTLYGAFNFLGFQLKVYLARGFAILANPETQEVRERWYFPPTTESLFIQSYASGYSTEPIKEQE